MKPVVILFLIALAPACAGAPPAPASPPVPADKAGTAPHLVVVSFDGMRYDFTDRVPTPGFDRVAAAGVRATGLIPSYPSKTFPNHYTLATGLYPSNHGIVDNAFYDPSLDATYSLGDTLTVRDGRWYGGEPIWVTAERQGVRAASFFWVGSEAEIGGLRPSYFKYYDHDFPYAARVDTVLHWLSLPDTLRPRLVMLYFSEPDHAAHVGGPSSPRVDSVVIAMDALLGRLLDGIEDLAIAEHVNVVVLSDHGMGPAPAEQVVHLEDVVDLDGVRVVHNTTQTLLYFDGDEARLWSVYEALQERLEHATVHLKEEVPARWHYDHGRRIGDLVVAAEPGWVIRPRGGREWSGGGVHGWDPSWRPMHGMFMAAGPGIRPGGEIAAFDNIHVYPFLARLLGVEPAGEIDGRLEILEAILAAPAGAPR